MWAATKKPLTSIFSISLKSLVFPEQTKTAKVRPIDKKGNKYGISNYRPISIAQFFSKILQKLMSSVKKRNVLNDSQNEFRGN